jgi:pimeloyl-ACP methyl ester carboxylesterase
LPVLIIRGDADPYLSREISQRLHEEIKDNQLLRIKTGGHFIQEDEPERVVEILDRFLG